MNVETTQDTQSQDELVPHIPIVRAVNYEARAEAARELPSREQRRENLSNLEVQCDAQCGKTLPRSALKVCSRCKQARYCSQACQKAHCWRSAALAVPKIVEHFWMISIALLRLLKNKSAANTVAIRAESEDKQQIALQYSKFVAVPLAEAPARTQKAAENARERLQRERRDADGGPARAEDPVITYYFATEEDQTGKAGLVSAAWVLPEWTLKYMNSNPTSILRSGMIEDKTVPVTLETLIDGVNSVILMDKANQLRLRAWPSKERPEPLPQRPEFVIHETEDEDAAEL